MNILSKQLLYKPQTPSVETYEAYYINNGTMTLLGDITDLSKTFAPQDDFIYSNLFVYEGNLYENGVAVTTGRNITYLTGRTTSSSYYGYFIDDGKLYRFNSSMSISQVGTNSNWLKVCGYTSTSGNYRSFAEASDGLYVINSDSTTTKISTLTGWTKITGYGSTSSSSYYGYGIHNGALYYLYANGNGAVQKGESTAWLDITGSREGTSWYGYGIDGGKLYKLSGTPSQTGTGIYFTKVSGTASSSAYAMSIIMGALRLLRNTTTTKIASSTDWQNFSGFCLSSGTYALAYDSTALYGILGDATTTKLMDGNWVYCGGNYSSGDAYGIAIRRK